MRTRAAAFGAGLEHHRTGRDEIGRSRHIQQRAQRGVQIGNRRRRQQRLAHPVRRSALRLFLEPLRPLGRRRFPQVIQANRRRRTALLT